MECVMEANECTLRMTRRTKYPASNRVDLVVFRS
jgi:hypothetical protein